jgi:hypothetical protein
MVDKKVNVVESKFKFLMGKWFETSYLFLGEPFKDKFEGLILSDAATESNFIKSNGVFTAVSNILS